MSAEANGAFPRVEDLWDSRPVPSENEVDLLIHRSNCLGADLAVTNFAGGNTSSKLTETDPLTGEPVTILWVKGSGGDSVDRSRGRPGAGDRDRREQRRGQDDTGESAAPFS